MNPNVWAHLRGLESEFGESSNAIRQELNRFEQAGMLQSKVEGNKKLFKVNHEHPLFNDIQNIIKKFIGIDVIVDQIVLRLGHIEAVYLTGSLARGINDHIIDLVIVGNPDKQFLVQLIEKAERLIHRKIRYLIYSSESEPGFLNQSNAYVLLWNR